MKLMCDGGWEISQQSNNSVHKYYTYDERMKRANITNGRNMNFYSEYNWSIYEYSIFVRVQHSQE